MKRRHFVGSVLATAAASSLPIGRVLAAAYEALGAVGSDVNAVAMSGREIILPKAVVNDLKASLRGQLLLAGDDGYDQARKVWNGVFDRRPALIARCAGAADVRNAVNFARDNGVLLAVKSGGHSLSGQSVCQGGMVIDLSLMRGVRIDPVAKIARVDAGVLLGEFDREAQAFGLVTTAGTVSHTGAAGLTLGGGFGRIGRKYGLTCDNLRSVDIITADGHLLTASAEQNPDLFWGLRGGGGNFGIATSFEYRLHAMSPMILGGNVTWPIEQARDVLNFYADYSSRTPDELNTDATLLVTPDGHGMVMVEACYNGAFARGENILRPLRQFGKPMSDDIAAMPYVKLQASGDEGYPFGGMYAVKSGFIKRLEPALVGTIVEGMRGSDTRLTAVSFQQAGGAINRVRQSDTAFPIRDARFDMLVAAKWNDRAHAEENLRFVRDYWATLQPFTSGFYVNTYTGDDQDKVRTNYGANYERLLKLKNKFDPKNLFRLNANIKPSV